MNTCRFHAPIFLNSAPSAEAQPSGPLLHVCCRRTLTIKTHPGRRLRSIFSPHPSQVNMETSPSQRPCRRRLCSNLSPNELPPLPSLPSGSVDFFCAGADVPVAPCGLASASCLGLGSILGSALVVAVLSVVEGLSCGD